MSHTQPGTGPLPIRRDCHGHAGMYSGVSSLHKGLPNVPSREHSRSTGEYCPPDHPADHPA